MQRGSRIPRIPPDPPGSPKGIRPLSADPPYVYALAAFRWTLINIILLKETTPEGRLGKRDRFALQNFRGAWHQPTMSQNLDLNYPLSESERGMIQVRIPPRTLAKKF